MNPHPRSLSGQILLSTVFLAAMIAFPNCGAVASAASEISGPEVELLGSTGDCPAELRLTGTLGEPADVDLADFAAVADAATTRVRVFCAVRLKINVPLGLEALVSVPEIRGQSVHSAVGTASLSVRWYAAGTTGDQWFKRVNGDEDSAAPFTETPAGWQPRWFACGESPELTLMIDATARVRLESVPEDSPSAPAPVESIGVQHFQVPGVLYRRCAADRT